MFGNGEASVFDGSLNFYVFLTDGRRFGVVIFPDERPEEPCAAPGFFRYHGQPITPAVVRSYLPDYAEITWRCAPPTFFGRTEERGTNGRYRIGLLAGKEGPDAATPDEMRNWLAVNVYGLGSLHTTLEPGDSVPSRFACLKKTQLGGARTAEG